MPDYGKSRIYNFSAGPSMPLEVLKKAQSQMLNYEESGMSVMEMSHRSKAYDAVITKTQEERMRSIMNIPDNYKVLFLQEEQPLSFPWFPESAAEGYSEDYIVTGYFANKAYARKQKYGEIVLQAQQGCGLFYTAQQELQLNKDADYVYLCANNTIYGTE